MTYDIWVIGGTSGIGEATAVLLDQQTNFDIAVTDQECDVRNEGRLRYKYLELGYPRYVVYSAGINNLMWNHQQRMDEVQDLFDVNVFGFMRLLKVIAEIPTTSTRRVVAISSDAARRPMRTSMAYCASKAALDMCVKQAAREFAPHILVNAVAPGMTAPTGMSDYIDKKVPVIRGWTPEQAAEYERSQIPIGRRIHPEEVAAAVKYLLLDAPLGQTGSIMEVNGGR